MNDLGKLRDQIKATVTMDDVCERLGIRVPRDRKIPSIYKPEKTPSLHIYKADYYDYSTGEGGDVIRFVMDAKGWSFPRAVKWIARASSSSFVSTRLEVEEPEDIDLTPEWRKAIENTEHYWPTWDDYALEKWGLTLHEIMMMGSTVAPDGNLWTPHWHDNVVRGIKVRSLNGSKWSITGSQYTHGLYVPDGQIEYGWHQVPSAYIVEGESDAWCLVKWLNDEDGPGHVFGLPSGAGLWKDRWRNSLKPYARVYIVFDDDDAGNEARERVSGSIRTMGGIEVFQLYPTHGGRVAEALKADSAPYTWHAVYDGMGKG